MTRDLLERILVKVLLWLAMQMVEIFNAMDDGPVDYHVTEREPFEKT